MYVRGISIEHIRRFCRWASDTFRRYLYRDNQVFCFVINAMAMATGLLEQLQMTQPEPKQVMFVGEEESEEDIDSVRVVGKGAKTRSTAEPEYVGGAYL